MVKEIIQIGDKRLTEISEEVDLKTLKTSEIKTLIQDLIDTCIANEKSAAGLSAVQLGILKRIWVVRRLDLEKGKKRREGDEIRWDVMINPVLSVTGNSKKVEWEGCMSIGTGHNRLFGPVERPEEIRVEYFDENGNKQSLDVKGFFAHLLQHENDHLNGKLFLRYIQNPKNIWKESDLDQYLDKYGSFPPIV